MIRFCLIMFLVGLSADAQKLELKIDSIVADDSDAYERKFAVHYYLENLTDDKLLFFQDLNEITPSTSGSSIEVPYFKIFEENTLIERNVFNGWSNQSYSHGTRKTALNNNQ
ncbi:MAG: hypothetical protein EOP48_17560, partial [Sphingobacteriales bacterium]